MKIASNREKKQTRCLIEFLARRCFAPQATTHLDLIIREAQTVTQHPGQLSILPASKNKRM
jgi:hypothetical protein